MKKQLRLLLSPEFPFMSLSEKKQEVKLIKKCMGWL